MAVKDRSDLRATEQLYREVRELRAVVDAGFTQLGADVTQLRKTQADTERKVNSSAAWAELKFDAITWATLLTIIVVSQAYVAIARNAPDWVRKMLPMVEDVEPATAAAPAAPGYGPFSMATLDQSPVKVGQQIAPGLAVTSLFRPPHRPRHNGIDVGGPVGTPYFAPAAVAVRCYWDSSGGGNVAEFKLDGHLWQLLHLKANTCQPGQQQPGAVIGELGNTGRSTGPHLHFQIRPTAGGDFINPRLGHLRAVLLPPARGIDFSGPVTDEILKRAIGRAEGTRDHNGNPTRAYQGHKDPGWSGRCANQGSFSYQHCAGSPEEADRRWLAVLRKAEADIQAQAQAKFGRPLSNAALVAALDGYTQSPDAGKRFISHLPTADPSPAQLIAARTAALNDSRRARGGPAMNVPADQQRRVNALLEQLR